MPFKTPDFWYNQAPSSKVLSGILMPIAALYQLGHKINTGKQTAQKAQIPIICIGNLTAGGGGKTPTAIAVSKLLKSTNMFREPYFLTKGYGAERKDTRIIKDQEAQSDTGDEPKILSRYCKTIISMNRYDGAKLAHASGADVVIMDDGYQNNTIFKDVSLLVIDGKTGLGNKKTIPAGPLREHALVGLNKADAVIIVGKDLAGSKLLIPAGKKTFKAFLDADLSTIDRNNSYLAFCGLAHPEKFYATLKDHHVQIKAMQSFADHHRYTQADIETLIDEAQRRNCRLITTEKDFVKIPDQYHTYIDCLKVQIRFEDEKALAVFLIDRLGDYIEKP